MCGPCMELWVTVPSHLSSGPLSPARNSLLSWVPKHPPPVADPLTSACVRRMWKEEWDTHCPSVRRGLKAEDPEPLVGQPELERGG